MLLRLADLVTTSFVLGCCVSLSSQTPVAALPADPAAMMQVAHEKNGLVGTDILPWHLRGTYHTYDRKGNVEDEGLYEEWWINPTKYKRSFSSRRFAQTDFANGNGLFREGAQDWPAGYELPLREGLIDPMPSPSLLKGFDLKEHSEQAGPSKIECVSMLYPLRPDLTVRSVYFPTYCFESPIPHLRLSSPGSSSRTVYDHIVNFQGHYLAKEEKVFFAGKLQADMSLDVIETLKNPGDEIVSPSPDAKAVDLTTISLKKSASQFPALLKNATPVYPQEARSTRIRGTVVIRAAIGADGHVGKMQVIDGPIALRQASLDAVSQWIYRPLKVLGQERPFELEVTVIFTMG